MNDDATPSARSSSRARAAKFSGIDSARARQRPAPEPRRRRSERQGSGPDQPARVGTNAHARRLATRSGPRCRLTPRATFRTVTAVRVRCLAASRTLGLQLLLDTVEASLLFRRWRGRDLNPRPSGHEHRSVPPLPHPVPARGVEGRVDARSRARRLCGAVEPRRVVGVRRRLRGHVALVRRCASAVRTKRAAGVGSPPRWRWMYEASIDDEACPARVVDPRWRIDRASPAGVRVE